MSTAEQHETSHFVVVHGAHHQGSHFSELKGALEARGNVVDTPDLPGDDLGACLRDEVTVIKNSIERQAEPSVLVLHSRAAETLRVLDYANKDSVAGVIIYNSGGSHDFTPTPDLPRYTKRYENATTKNKHGLYVIDRAVARSLFFEGASDGPELEAMLDNLRPQRPVSQDEMPLPRLPLGVTVKYLQGKTDPVLNIERVRLVAPQWLGVELEMMPGGHSPHVSHATSFADKLIHIARQMKVSAS